ncbi:8-oxo-dGTP diphosphatase MutT [Virgisporangium ochraceum]|uniref:NTP pyrophosphohydrolase n=1 Tax=Virgisporangium ochraceum TaxID=65505 RepID=A0A8J3ZWX1_9ACTN|nr:NUDIX hydrolase [Virgisporangium ochraceum]GIJ69975.1 NTP pyrophosphohydrolase [Virgisporangium ochraceum]
MTDSAQKRPAIAAAIVVKDGRILMVRRSIREGELSWQFPAGEIEPGESEYDAAVRETAEETGVRVRAIGKIGARIHPSTGRDMIYVACEAISGDAHVADPEELDAVEWCDRAKLAEHVPYPLFDPVQAHVDNFVK